MKKLLPFIILLFFSSNTHAVTVLSVSGSAVHGGSITITGSDFGGKSPAAPLMWDDGESATVDTPSQVAARGWEDVRPLAVEPDDPTYALMYRTSWQSMAHAHERSTKYLAGGYYSACGGQPCNNVQVSISSTAGSQNHTYATWYLRADPAWEDISYCTNYKEWFLRDADAAEWGDVDGLYFAAAGAPTFCDGGANIHLQQRGCPPSQTNPTGVDFTSVPSPTKAWVHREVIARFNPGYVAFLTNNVHATGSPNYGDNDYCSDGNLETLGGMTIGGYARDAEGGATDNRMRLWFDDIYVDITWSRVMICNNATYSSATICEPQIPSAWSTSSITAAVNRGALNVGTNYLFVFDSNNATNATGYAVTISDGTTGIGGGVTLSGASVQ